MKRNSLTGKISILLIYLYFALFLVSNIILPFGKMYNAYAVIIEFVIVSLIFILNLNVVLKEKRLFFISILIVALAIISIMTTGGGIGSIFNLAKFLMGILLFSHIDCTDRGKKRLFYLCSILWIFYFILSPRIWSLYKGGDSPTNPNTVGIILFFASTVMGDYLLRKTEKRRMNWLFVTCLYVLTFVAIMNTQCRSAFLAMLVFLALNYIPFLRGIVLKMKKTIMYLVTTSGTFFPLLYAQKSISNVNIGTLMSYSEKSLYTGREYLWGKMIEGMNMDRLSYVVGMGTKFETAGGEVLNNYHNWYFGMVYAFGIPVYLLYYYVFISLASRLSSYTILCGLIALMVIGFFETIGLNGAAQTCIFIYFILGSKE